MDFETRDVILAHIASIVIAVEKAKHPPDDETLAPLLKRLQTSVINLSLDDRGGSSTEWSTVREAFVDLYPALFGQACSECTIARVTYLSCLQTLVKMNPKSFHGDWPRLLGGSSDGETRDSGETTQRYSMNVNGNPRAWSNSHALYAHLGDEAPKLRHAAAASISTLIEGPAQRAYLAMAKVPGTGDRKVRSFISLSEVLGRMVAVNVEALRLAVAREGDDGACAAMVRALTTFLMGPWSGNKGALAWSCLEVLLAKVDNKGRSRSETDLAAACLGSLASIFGLNDLLHDGGNANKKKDLNELQRRVDATLDVLVRCLAREKSTRVKLEAAAALRAALRYRRNGLNIQAEYSNHWSTASTVHLLAPLVAETKAALVVASTAKRKENAREKKEHSNQERLIQQLVLLLGEVREADWQLVCSAARHPSARIRAAAFSCFASCINETNRDACLDLAEVHAAEATERESTVRSSAVKAYLVAIVFQSMTPAPAAANTDSHAHDVNDAVHENSENGENGDTDLTTYIMRDNNASRVVRFVASSLNDSVLAVRINAAVLAADISANLWHSCMEHLTDVWRGTEMRQRGIQVLSELLRSALDACRDHEKVAVHGIRALGYLVGGIIRLGGSRTRPDVLEARADEIVSVIESCMARGKKELAWSCAEAATVACMLEGNGGGDDHGLISRLRIIQSL